MLSLIFIVQLRIFRGAHKELVQTTLAALDSPLTSHIVHLYS